MAKADNRRQPGKPELTIVQLNAVDLLVTGTNDRETAELIGVSRQTVTAWRLYDVEFRAEVNQRRKEIWGVSADRLRALLPRSMDVLLSTLEGPNAWKVAIEVLRLVARDMLPEVSRAGSGDADELLTEEADRRYGLAAQLLGARGISAGDLDRTREELAARISEAESAGQPERDVLTSGTTAISAADSLRFLSPGRRVRSGEASDG